MLTPHLAMVVSGYGNWGWQSRIQLQANHKVLKQSREMPRTLSAAQRNAGQFGIPFHRFQPILNGSIGLALQDGSDRFPISAA